MSVGIDPRVASAKAAGLRYMAPGESGMTRIRHGNSCLYRDAKGRAVHDRATLERIRRLVIPPAWADVWICADPRGHLQATGRDARGRKQYRYHGHWTAAREEAKYDQTIAFARALPAIRRRVNADLKKRPLSRAHVLATIVRLLEKTFVRIGNKEYAHANDSYGLTTLRDEHVRVTGRSIHFSFRAKSGVMQNIDLTDATLARNVQRCRRLPGRALFQYLDEEGGRQCVDSADVNAYLKEMTGQPFTAKNFRTWAGTVLAAEALCERPAPSSEAAFKREVVRAVDHAAGRLGNTRAVCRKCYIHPAVFEAFRGGVTIKKGRVDAEESAVLQMLETRARRRRAEPARAA